MPYLIDGHNLIPKVPGMSLEAIDDELQLVGLLQEFCRFHRKEVEVFFDNAPAGQPRVRNFGSVTARFVRQGTTADDAIRAKLNRLGKDARNWIVVSSDRAVQASARAAHARVMPSETFVQMMTHIYIDDEEVTEDSGVDLTEQELDDWLKIFGSRKNKSTS